MDNCDPNLASISVGIDGCDTSLGDSDVHVDELDGSNTSCKSNDGRIGLIGQKIRHRRMEYENGTTCRETNDVGRVGCIEGAGIEKDNGFRLRTGRFSRREALVNVEEMVATSVDGRCSHSGSNNEEGRKKHMKIEYLRNSLSEKVPPLLISDNPAAGRAGHWDHRS
jgi:hypothetical protein